MDRYNVPMPHTWDELLAVAKWMNGTDTDGDGVGDLYGACFDVAPGELTAQSASTTDAWSRARRIP